MLGISDQDTVKIVKILEKYAEVKRAAVFGSRAKGNYKPGSDIDMAVFGDEINPQIITRLMMELNEESPLPYSFDVVDHKTIKNIDLKDHIERVGKIIYQRASNKH